MAGKEASSFMAIAQRKPRTRPFIFNVSSDLVKFSVFSVSIGLVKLSCHFHLISGGFSFVLDFFFDPFIIQ